MSTSHTSKFRIGLVAAVVAGWLVIVAPQVFAIAFTTAQFQAIKADIAANSDLNTLPDNQDVADKYNANASPAFIVWKVNVDLTSIGSAFDSAELANRTTADTSNLQTMAIYSPKGVNPSTAGVRSFFDNIFSGSGGANTRTNLAALWKRPARRIEKLFATGTGTTASPATLVVEGTVTAGDILNARNAP